MDVEERDDAITLALELPGVKRDDVQVSVENGMLTISGEKKTTRENVDDTRLVERRFGRFERVLSLPQSVDAERISAHYDNGVLTLHLPKSAESRRRKIQIGSGPEQMRIESGDSGARRSN